MTSEADFLHAIHEAPDDALTKLVYADWLEENGDPAAEVLRALVAWQERPDAATRQPLVALFTAPAARRFRRLAGVGTLSPARRGLFRLAPQGIPGPAQALPLLDWGWVTELACERPRLLGDLHRLVERLPWLRRVALRVRGAQDWPEFDAVSRHPVWRHLVALDLDDSPYAASNFFTLLPAWPADQIEELSLRNCGLFDSCGELLASLAGLRVLDLADNLLGDGIAQALAASPHLGRLEHLDLSHTGLGDEGLRALLESPHLGSLRILGLDGTPLGPAGVVLLLGSRFAPPGPVRERDGPTWSFRLAEEVLSLTGLVPGVLEPFRHLPQLSEVTALEVDGIVPASGLGSMLARWPALPRLTRLSLEVDLDDFDLASLLQWLDPYRVRRVDLGKGRLSLDALRTLLRSDLAGAAERLEVETHDGHAVRVEAGTRGRCWTLTAPSGLLVGLPPAVVEEVRGLRLVLSRLTRTEAGRWANLLPPHLETFAVASPQLQDGMLPLLLAAPGLRGLRRLEVVSDVVTAAGGQAVADADLPALTELVLQGRRMPRCGAALDALRERGVSVLREETS